MTGALVVCLLGLEYVMCDGMRDLRMVLTKQRAGSVGRLAAAGECSRRWSECRWPS